MILLLRWLVRLLYGFRAYNVPAPDTPGPVLLLPNHVSWWDWVFIGVCLEKDWRFVTSSTTAQISWFHRRIMINRRTFPVDMSSPYAVKHIAEYLQRGGRLVLFPEGRISMTGSLMKLFDGTGFLIYKTRAKVITAYVRGAHRLPFSRNPDRKKWFPRVSVHFSSVLAPPRFEHASVTEARLKLTDWLRDQMVRQKFDTEMEFGPATVPEAIRRAARQRPRQVMVEDITLRKLSGQRLLMGAEALAAQWGKLGHISTAASTGPLSPALSPLQGERKHTRTHRTARRSLPLPLQGGEGRGEGAGCWSRRNAPRQWLDQGERRVGVLLPNVNAFPVVLLSLWRANRVPAILNYTTGPAVLLACARLAGLKQIVTSKAFVARAKLDLAALRSAGIDLVFLEDVREAISPFQKLAAALRARFHWGASRQCHHPAPSPPAGERAGERGPEDTAVILFTSGSEGEPKGVELTHRNLLANIRQMLAVIDLMESDRFFTALPLFHSFGLTIGLLLPLVQGVYVFLYPSPLHYRVVPSAFYNLNCTVFFGTNTFLAGYARKGHPYDFRSLRYLFAGAEKIQESTSALWMRQFGVRVLEGYGVTECSPCLSVNLPMHPRQGSAGQFLPAIEYRLEPVEGIEKSEVRSSLTCQTGPTSPTCPTAPDAPRTTHHDSALNTGRLFVRGPNVMRGYLNPEANARFQALGGWYDTGDIARVDEDGFVYILGRLKRFAKVSGEMISLMAVEDALAGAFPHYGLRFAVAVINKPDEEKGEKLIAVTNEPRLTLEEIRQAIRARGLGNLAVPREIKVLRELPRLGTGKVNHRELEGMV